MGLDGFFYRLEPKDPELGDVMAAILHKWCYKDLAQYNEPTRKKVMEFREDLAEFLHKWEDFHPEMGLPPKKW